MNVIKTIIEIIFSPFTILFRTKQQKNPNKIVNIFLVVLISLILTGVLLVLAYYERLFH